ncbi:hypothetical protein L0Y69_01495 [bacterium]|nr:hypothetical protein [bacterium]
MKLLLATNNGGKIERFRKLLLHIDAGILAHTPGEMGIPFVEVEESGETIADNAELKARAFAGKTDLLIVGNDTGLYVEGEGLIDAPKRRALGEAREGDLTKEEVASKVLQFWKSIAMKHGGEVSAAWVETFAALYPNGDLVRADSRREIILTDREFGMPHVQFPMRALYYSKATGKPAIQHTEEEETLEMKPVIAALAKALRIKI